jgi:tRNA nucleotidyltransferase (CCA-adding enzyme)
MFDSISHIIETNFGKKALLVGSVGKGTFIKDDKDLDIFVLFSPDTPREKLEKEGLEIGKAIFSHYNAPYEVAYAEHPYTSGIVEGYSVEIVPCFDIESPSSLLSAVDRTPFHLSYVLENMNESQKDDVRLLKRFLKAQKLYGADARAQGFSGYLCELLILYYSSFRNLIANAVTWEKKTVVPLVNSEKEFDDPLVLVDPVDPARNVASAVRATTYARFILACRTYEFTKSDKMFIPAKKGYSAISGGRLLAVELTSPVIEDTFFAQARKYLDYIVSECERHGFSIYQSGLFRKGILLDVEIGTLPPMERHVGPPIFSYQNAKAFEEKYEEVGIAGDNRLYAFKQRTYTDIIDIIEASLKDKTGMGAHLKRAKARILEGDAANELASGYVVFMK